MEMIYFGDHGASARGYADGVMYNSCIVLCQYFTIITIGIDFFTLVLALEGFFVKVDKTNTRLLVL